MKSILLSLVIVLGALGNSLIAQPLSEWLQAAEQAFENEDYYSAYRYYDVALKYDTTRMDLWYKLGESAQEFTAYKTASNAYSKVAASTWRDSFPLLAFKQAEVLQAQGQYQRAAALYDGFITNQSQAPADVLEKAERNLINSEWAAEIVTRPVDAQVRHLGEGINSPYSDFGLFRKQDTLYFSSLRFVFQRDSLRPKREVTKILRRSAAGGDIQPLPKEINQDGRLAAHTAYNSAATKVYFTLCDYQGSTYDFRCDIYVSTIDDKGRWTNPQKLAVNDPNATNTHPNVGFHPVTGEEYLYFSSNRSGGKGGLDLYRSKIMDNGSLGGAENLSDINTTGDDVTPFYYAPTQVLYFSSNGRLTLGGFDIYRASWNGSNWDRPVNMGLPVNTGYNDTYYSRYIGDQRAYLASNRPDTAAIFWDDSKDACCNDIYSVAITDEIKLLVLNFNKLTNQPLPASSVALYELGPNGKRLIDSLYNPTANDFNFTLLPGKVYVVEGTKPGYSMDSDTIDLNDPALAQQKEIERRLYLSPGIELDVFTWNGVDSTKLAGTTVFLYELTPEGELILIDSIINPLDNDYHFRLQHGKQYTLFARKDGYTTASDFIDVTDPALAGVSRLRRDLYLSPALFLEVYTFRAKDKLPLVGTTVSLFEYTPTGEVLLQCVPNNFGHQFGFHVERGKQYIIKGEKAGYGPDETSLDLTGPDVPVTGTFRRDLFLGQLLEVYTFDARTELPLPGAEVKLIDPLTGTIIAERINPDSNFFYFTVDLDKPYRLEVTRKGYKPFSEEVRFSDEDIRLGGGKIIYDVYLEPLDDPDSMLPLMLYYDNDYPDPRSTRPSTNVEYVATNIEYFQKKQEFIQNYTKGMALEQAFLTRRSFEDFFKREVQGGRFDLEEFSKRLLAHLQGGNSFKMNLVGFASPRANTVYNDLLSARRIVAVKNYFERYQDGVFLPYLASGALSYMETPVGERQANPRVSDKMEDLRASVYDVLASLERRVEVRSTVSQ